PSSAPRSEEMALPAVVRRLQEAVPQATAEVIRLSLPRRAKLARAVPWLRAVATRVIPPAIGLGIALGLWQVLCSGPGPTLPSPSRIWHDAKELILDPFFVYGPQDVGLGWRLLVSLRRVGVGYGFAAVAGITLGTIVGSSVWAMRALDPIFQVLRTVPPLA